MSTISLKIDGIDAFEKDINAGAKGVQREITAAMSKSVNTVKNAAQLLAPYKTGTLRRSIFTDIKNNGLQGVVAQDTDIAVYGPMVEFGTKSHEILPVNKQALFWNGALNPYRRIMHPGTSAHPFMIPALENNVEAIKKYFDEAILNLVLIMAGKK